MGKQSNKVLQLCNPWTFSACAQGKKGGDENIEIYETNPAELYHLQRAMFCVRLSLRQINVTAPFSLFGNDGWANHF